MQKKTDPESNFKSFSESDVNKLVPGYDPWIGDVPIDSKGEPFHVIVPKETRTKKELRELQREIKEKIYDDDAFDPPIKLSDYCLVAKEIWKEEDSDEENCICCQLG